MISSSKNGDRLNSFSLSKIQYGGWSNEGEKIRIFDEDSESSILFEDTASITYEKVNLINWKLFAFGFFGGILFATATGEKIIFYISLVLGLVGAFVARIKYDIVTIESKGGQTFSLNTMFGDGKKIMNQIEDAKRNWKNKE